jgi:hypothetical protein
LIKINAGSLTPIYSRNLVSAGCNAPHCELSGRLPPVAQWGMAMVSLVAAAILLPVLIAAALQTRNDWKTEKIDHRLIEIGPLF